MGSDAQEMKIRGDRDTSFGDYPLYGWFIHPAGAKPTIDAQRMILIMNTYSLAIFDKPLKDMTSTLFDGLSADFPEVIFGSNHVVS
jgi:hypothetical protein